MAVFEPHCEAERGLSRAVPPAGPPQRTWSPTQSRGRVIALWFRIPSITSPQRRFGNVVTAIGVVFVRHAQAPWLEGRSLPFLFPDLSTAIDDASTRSRGTNVHIWLSEISLGERVGVGLDRTVDPT